MYRMYLFTANPSNKIVYEPSVLIPGYNVQRNNKPMRTYFMVVTGSAAGKIKKRPEI